MTINNTTCPVEQITVLSQYAKDNASKGDEFLKETYLEMLKCFNEVKRLANNEESDSDYYSKFYFGSLVDFHEHLEEKYGWVLKSRQVQDEFLAQGGKTDVDYERSAYFVRSGCETAFEVIDTIFLEKQELIMRTYKLPSYGLCEHICKEILQECDIDVRHALNRLIKMQPNNDRLLFYKRIILHCKRQVAQGTKAGRVTRYSFDSSKYNFVIIEEQCSHYCIEHEDDCCY
jgi:hypothetical protein